MPKKATLDRSNVFANRTFLRRRELGFAKKLGFDDELCKKITLSLDGFHTESSQTSGGIFNLEFSQNGSILAAACERKCICLYDPLSSKLIHRLNLAHSNCVNCIKFLDSNSFASGSDDTTIKIWDLRYLSDCTHTLKGHRNWVKNLEYSASHKSLISSAFDGGVYMWELKNFTENNVIYDRVYFMDGLMRTKLTPDGSKMVLCSTNGYILVIHDLHLETLYTDLEKFKPGLYRLMQMSDQHIPSATKFNKYFASCRRRNRVELISDFPNDAEVISSLQIHPMGWCSLTRNINNDETSEWTCVHDIQERFDQKYIYKPTQPLVPPPAPTQNEINQNRNPMDLWFGSVSNGTYREQRLRGSIDNRGARASGIRTMRTSVQVLTSEVLPPADEEPSSDNENEFEQNTDTYRIVQNFPRLTYFSEEPNVGKGFIKEICFSPDGRIVCSPYMSGVRLYAFSNACNELSMCVPKEPEKLTTVMHFKDYHMGIVVSCQFSPYHNILVSGCLSGQLVWYMPKF